MSDKPEMAVLDTSSVLGSDNVPLLALQDVKGKGKPKPVTAPAPSSKKKTAFSEHDESKCAGSECVKSQSIGSEGKEEEEDELGNITKMMKVKWGIKL
jgi:hypothetical protein